MDSKILFVDDGSRDRTWSIIARESIRNPLVTELNLPQRRSSKRITCWLSSSEGNVTAPFPLIVIFKMTFPSFVTLSKISPWWNIMVRDSRETDTWFKRTTALSFTD